MWMEDYHSYAEALEQAVAVLVRRVGMSDVNASVGTAADASTPADTNAADPMSVLTNSVEACTSLLLHGYRCLRGDVQPHVDHSAGAIWLGMCNL